MTIKLQVTTKKRGKGFWKLNNSLLKDEIYKQGIKNIIKKFKIEHNNFDNQLKWEMCKIKIREYSIKYASDVSKKRKKHITSIEEEYNELCKKLDNDQSTKNIDKIDRLKHEIDKWYEYQCKGAYVRSRPRWLEFGEKSSKYFFTLKRQKARKKKYIVLILMERSLKMTRKFWQKYMNVIANFTKKMMLSLISKTTSVIYNTLLKSDVTPRDHVVRCRGSQECGSRNVNFACRFHRRSHRVRITLKSTTFLFMRSKNVWTTKPWQRS